MENVKAKDIMIKNVIVFEENAPIPKVIDTLTEKKITGAPVVDSYGKLSGVVSLTDILHRNFAKTEPDEKEQGVFYSHAWNDQEVDSGEFKSVKEDGNKLENLTVKDIMSHITLTVDQETSVIEMAETMMSYRIHRLVVTSDDKVVGIVTTMDMLKCIRDYNK